MLEDIYNYYTDIIQYLPTSIVDAYSEDKENNIENNE